MLVWVVYDIVDTKKRTKIARACQNYGLYRVQKSVFLGNISSNDIDELTVRCKDLINIKKDSIYIFPMCLDDFKKVKLLGQAFDKKFISDEIMTKFF